MPAPTVTVVFQDAEGDEFPYTLGEQGYDETAIRIAREYFDRDVANGDVRPVGIVIAHRVER